MIKLQFLILLLNSFLFNNYIYEGKIFPGYRCYISNIESNKIIVEVGGTTTKMGGEYIILSLCKVINDKGVIAYSDDKKCLLYKCNSGYSFEYNGRKGTHKFNLKRKEKSLDIEKIRVVIFRTVFEDKYKKVKDYNIILNDFRNFEKAPYEYLISK